MASLPALINGVTARIERARRRSPFVDHLLSTQEHYSRVQGSNQAGGISYYGFLSFFPLVALALFVVGKVAQLFPKARDPLTSVITSAFPGVLGEGEHALPLSTLQAQAGTLGWIGLAGALITGLGWMSSMRGAMLAVFDVEPEARPDPILGKLRDLVTLPVLGLILTVSVLLSGGVARYTGEILAWLGLSEGLAPAVRISSLVIGVAASTLLFLAMFVILGRPALPTPALVRGALIAAVGFEVLKNLASFLLTHTEGTPAFQLFGIALILIIWINYFARLALYGASWAQTSVRPPRGSKETEETDEAEEPEGEPQPEQS